MYKVNDKLYIREANITHIKFYEGQEAYIGTTSGLMLSCTDEEGRALLEHLNGSYNDVAAPAPAADVPGKMRHITSVECYVSGSGNKTWRAVFDAGVVYFRQAYRELLEQAGLWEQLDRMHIGDVWEADIVVYTVPDGDFHKPIRFDQNGLVIPPLPGVRMPYVSPLIQEEDDPDDLYDANDEPFVRRPNIAPLALETDDLPDEHFEALADSALASLAEEDAEADAEYHTNPYLDDPWLDDDDDD